MSIGYCGSNTIPHDCIIRKLQSSRLSLYLVNGIIVVLSLLSERVVEVLVVNMVGCGLTNLAQRKRRLWCLYQMLFVALEKLYHILLYHLGSVKNFICCTASILIKVES